VSWSRHVYAVLDDPEDKNSKLFVKAKNNLARDTKALRYGMGVKTVGHDSKLGVDITAPYITTRVGHGRKLLSASSGASFSRGLDHSVLHADCCASCFFSRGLGHWALHADCCASCSQ